MIVEIHTTLGSEKEAAKLAKKLLDKRLVACAGLQPLRSLYMWKQEMQDEQEVLVILKTSKQRAPEASSLIEEFHPYEIPCIVSREVKANRSYERWVEECCDG